MRCSACWAVGLLVPFCGLEHQRLIWCTHEAICGRVLTTPYIAPYTKQEHLNAWVQVSEDNGVRTINQLEPPLKVPGNLVLTTADLPQVYADMFNAEWDKIPTYDPVCWRVSDGGRDEDRVHRDLDQRRQITTILMEHKTLPPENHIFGPPLHPSTAPYALISCSLAHLYRQEEVSRGTNVIAYINALVVYATVATQYILDPHDSPANHPEQFEELAKRVMQEASKVKEQGRGVAVFDHVTRMWDEDQTNPLIWSVRIFELVLRRRIEEEVQVYPWLRIGLPL